jgi:hypothetical protein
MLNMLSTGDEDGTKQNIIFAISHKIGKSFSLSLKNSKGPPGFLKTACENAFLTRLKTPTR